MLLDIDAIATLTATPLLMPPCLRAFMAAASLRLLFRHDAAMRVDAAKMARDDDMPYNMLLLLMLDHEVLPPPPHAQTIKADNSHGRAFCRHIFAMMLATQPHCCCYLILLMRASLLRAVFFC